MIMNSYSKSSITNLQKSRYQILPNSKTQSINQISQSESFCRLCLNQIAQDQCFEACMCMGSLALIHENCLIQWLNKRKDLKQILEKKSALCQICKSEIKIDCIFNFQCLTFEQIKEGFFKEQCCSTFILIAVLGVLFLSWATTFFILPESQKFWICWVIVLILTITIYIFFHFFKFNKQIKSIIKKQPYLTTKQKKAAKIYPLSLQIQSKYKY